MKNSTKHSDFRWIEFIINCFLMVLLLCIIFSCGSRKTQSSSSETKTEFAIDQNTKLDSASYTKTEIKKDLLSDDVFIEPADTTKPIEITAPDGKVTKYKNARITHKKSVDKSTEVKTNKTAKTKVNNHHSTLKVADKKQERTTDRKQFDFVEIILQYWWLWLLIIVAIFIYKKYFT